MASSIQIALDWTTCSLCGRNATNKDKKDTHRISFRQKFYRGVCNHIFCGECYQSEFDSLLIKGASRICRLCGLNFGSFPPPEAAAEEAGEACEKTREEVEAENSTKALAWLLRDVSKEEWTEMTKRKKREKVFMLLYKQREDFECSPVYEHYCEMREELAYWWPRSSMVSSKLIDKNDSYTKERLQWARDSYEKFYQEYQSNKDNKLLRLKKKKRKLQEVVDKEGIFFERCNVKYAHRRQRELEGASKPGTIDGFRHPLQDSLDEITTALKDNKVDYLETHDLRVQARIRVQGADDPFVLLKGGRTSEDDMVRYSEVWLEKIRTSPEIASVKNGCAAVQSYGNWDIRNHCETVKGSFVLPAFKEAILPCGEVDLEELRALYRSWEFSGPPARNATDFADP